MNDGDALQQLAQPVNSAAAWAHLYVEDEVEVVVDLTTTTDGEDADELRLARPAPMP